MKKQELPPITMKVENLRLVPATSWAQEELDRYRNGSTVQVYVTQEQNDPLRKKYFAILSTVLKTCPTPWKTVPQAHEALKLALGHVNLMKTVSGKFAQYAKSLNDFDGPELEKYYEDSMAILHRMTGVDPETLHVESPAENIQSQQPASEPVSSAGNDDAGPAPDSPALIGAQEPAAQSDEPVLTVSEEDKAFMLEKMRIFVAGIGPDVSVISGMAQGFGPDIQTRNELVRAKLKSAVATVKRICAGEQDRDDGLTYIAGLIGCEVRAML